MKDNQKNTDPKAELVAKLEQMEEAKEREATDFGPVAPFIDNILTSGEADQRIGEHLEEAKQNLERRKELEEEKKRCEETITHLLELSLPEKADEQIRAHLEKVKRLQATGEPWDSEFWEREFLKELLPLFDGDFEHLERKKGKRNFLFTYKIEDLEEHEPFAFPIDDYYDRLERFKEDIRQGGAIVAKRIKENSDIISRNWVDNERGRIKQINEELKTIPEALNLSTTKGKKRNQQLTLPILEDLLNITEQEKAFIRSATNQRLKIAICQKMGLIRGKNIQELERFNDEFSKNFFTTKNIMTICNVGKKRALEILRTFSKANTLLPVGVKSATEGEAMEIIHFLKLGVLKDSNDKEQGLDYLRPKLSLDGLAYIQREGQKHNLPPLDSEPVRTLNDLAFRIMVQLGAYSHSIEAHHTKAELPEELWLVVNVKKLYEDLHAKTALTGGHTNRLKDEFIKAMEQLTANGIFRKAPFLGLPLRTKDGRQKEQVEISATPQLLKANTKVSLNGLKKPGTTWNDIIRGSLMFSLSFRSMAEKDQERLSKMIEGKRKARSIRTRKAKKSDRHHKGGSADREEGIIYGSHQ